MLDDYLYFKNNTSIDTSSIEEDAIDMNMSLPISKGEILIDSILLQDIIITPAFKICLGSSDSIIGPDSEEDVLNRKVIRIIVNLLRKSSGAVREKHVF